MLKLGQRPKNPFLSHEPGDADIDCKGNVRACDSIRSLTFHDQIPCSTAVLVV